jgi:D-glycero-D-manno-heptose 1,7-bisphosphate phosphatase
MKPAVFLDRDETLIRANSLPPPPPPANPGDVVNPAQVELLPGVLPALRALRDAGYTLVIYSNQGGVARGAINLKTVEAINDRLRLLLDPGLIEAFYVCPFHPKGKTPAWTREHPWRKPGPGMIIAAASELSLDLSRSWAVGDMQRDVEAAIAASIAPERCIRLAPDTSTPDLTSAVEIILQPPRPANSMKLTALSGNPLADPRTRATVIAAAGALAEHTGLHVLSLHADASSITITLDADRLTCLGFLAELRRNTNHWYAGRNEGRSLWGEADHGESL